jgi:putative tryptophan/tyrosine transport system substrate-binding protein
MILPVSNRDRVIEYAASHRIPTMYEDGTYVRDGGLISYGPRLDDGYRRASYFVDRILKGAKPGDLPMEQSTLYYLFNNRTTAKTLALPIPQSLLTRADEVIQ